MTAITIPDNKKEGNILHELPKSSEKNKNHHKRNIAIALGVLLLGVTAVVAAPEILEVINKMIHADQIPELELESSIRGSAEVFSEYGSSKSWSFLTEMTEDFANSTFFIDEFEPGVQYFRVTIESGWVRLVPVETVEEATHMFVEVEGTGGGVMQLIER